MEQKQQDCIIHIWESIGVIFTPGFRYYEIFKCSRCKNGKKEKINFID